MSGVGLTPERPATLMPDSWVAELISWWIDQDTGLPIPERQASFGTTDVAEPIRVLILRGRPSRIAGIGDAEAESGSVRSALIFAFLPSSTSPSNSLHSPRSAPWSAAHRARMAAGVSGTSSVRCLE